MKHSTRAKRNMTKQLAGMLKLLYKDLYNEQLALKKARTYLKYKLPGVKKMVRIHQAGVRKSKADIRVLSIRIRMRQRNGQINKIL